ncbi:unnamed protein product [Cylicostephanus goldi]|uniref:Transmembrane protein 144 n=1 Tax=Cylicostephanus goldi TaxID=71465 RepID=A0A3P6R767_CYLGO|nr:unnamed protein product [Cylicostephanus goldi]
MGSRVIGLGACALSSIFFGSAYVPVKRFDAGNGLFVQWVMSAAILCVGLTVNIIQHYPRFQPFAMLGGAFWALGNVTAIPIMSSLGMGMGMLIWGTTNCVTGWAVGRYGLFGTKAHVPAGPALNYLGLLMVIVGGFCFSQIRPSIRSLSHPEDINEGRVTGDDTEEGSPLISPSAPALFNLFCDILLIYAYSSAIFTALGAGVLYGVTFVPVIYMQDHPEIVSPSSS